MSCLQPQRDLVKREVSKQASRIVASQVSLFSEVFGKPIRPDIFDRDRATLRKTAEKWVDSAFDTFDVDWNTLSPNEQRKKLALFLDKLFRTVTRVPRGTHALVWYRTQMEEALSLRGN